MTTAVRRRKAPGVFVPEYAAGSEAEHFADFCREHLIQSQDRWDGMPLTMEPWQNRVNSEAMAFDEDGRSFWDSVIEIEPRKNGKTHKLAALGVYRMVTSGGSPEILFAASSDRQAKRLFDAASLFCQRSPTLDPLVHVRDYIGEIKRADGLGVIYRLAADAGKVHGYNPSLVVADELAQWTTPTLRRVWVALTTGGAARTAPMVYTITTAGEAHQRKTSILGTLLDKALRSGEVEARPGLQVIRHWKARTLIFNYTAPTTDPRDIKAMKLANPASWVTEEYLLRQAENPELSDQEVLQYHGCVWAEARGMWVPADVWAQLRGDAEIPEGASVCLGVDIGLVHDASAVGVAWEGEDGRVRLQAYSWCADPEASADEYVEDRVDLEDVEEHIREQARRYNVRVVAYDERFFERSAQMLRAEGLNCVPVNQQSAQMADAWQDFYSGVNQSRFVHQGDVLTAHVLGARGDKTDRGWKIRKLRQSVRIDSLVAVTLANYALSLIPPPVEPWAATW